jgi:hypothetical protein
MVAQLLPQTLREGRNGELRRRIDIKIGFWHIRHVVSRHRVHVDHVPGNIVLPHCLQGFPRADAQRHHVDVKDSAPFVGGTL